jgi:hypothetical protein
MPEWDAKFVCTHAFSGMSCGFGEMSTLGVFFWASALVSLFFLVVSIRTATTRIAVFDPTVVFWFFMILWQIYHGTINVAQFSWTVVTFRLWYQSLNHILMFIPMCFVILVLFNLLFTYRNPGANAMMFFRGLFFLFLLIFVVLGAVLSAIDVSTEETIAPSLGLWCACTDLLLVVFFALPARALLDAVTYPMVQPEDTCCVSFCKVGIVLYVLLFAGRVLWNGTQYFNGNVVQDWLKKQVAGARPTTPARLINFFCIFLFDFAISVLAMTSVYLFKKHDMMFNENPYYSKQND